MWPGRPRGATSPAKHACRECSICETLALRSGALVPARPHLLLPSTSLSSVRASPDIPGSVATQLGAAQGQAKAAGHAIHATPLVGAPWPAIRESLSIISKAWFFSSLGLLLSLHALLARHTRESRPWQPTCEDLVWANLQRAQHGIPHLNATQPHVVRASPGAEQHQTQAEAAGQRRGKALPGLADKPAAQPGAPGKQRRPLQVLQGCSWVRQAAHPGRALIEDAQLLRPRVLHWSCLPGSGLERCAPQLSRLDTVAGCP